MELMQNLLTPEDQRLMERLNEDIMEGPMLAIRDPYRIFYINTDWSKDGMGVVLIKSDDSVEAINSEAQEKVGENCEFDKSLEVIHLRPISFVSVSTVSPLEKSRYIFLGESSAVMCAIGKFRKYL